jgi:HSP20 family protein
MRLKSLVPFREASALMPPGFGLFGLHREMDRLFSEFAREIGPVGAQTNIIPNIEISDTDKAIEVSAEMPGLERKDVEISIEDDTLTIRGEKKVEENQKDKNVQLSERSYGVFYRVLELPPGVDPSSVQATMSNGILKVTIPKPAKSEPRKSKSRKPLESSKRMRDAFAVSRTRLARLREIAQALIAEKAVPATRKQFMDLQAASHVARKRDGATVVSQGTPARCRLKAAA